MVHLTSFCSTMSVSLQLAFAGSPVKAALADQSLLRRTVQRAVWITCVGLHRCSLSWPGTDLCPNSSSLVPEGDHLVATCRATSVVQTLPSLSTVIMCGSKNSPAPHSLSTSPGQRRYPASVRGQTNAAACLCLLQRRVWDMKCKVVRSWDIQSEAFG